MKVLRAARAGFCMGVDLALKKLEMAISRENEVEQGKRICTLGPIIHNPQVMQAFASRGVHCLNDPEDAMAGDCVLIRAHGIPRKMEQKLRERCGHVIDATCPKVKNAQMAIAKATAQGAELLLFGEAEHPEVQGLVSYANGKAHVFTDMEEIDKFACSPDKSYVLASQTTQDREIFEKISDKLQNVLSGLKVLSTICDATRERQQEALNLAGRVDVMVVAGGKQSGNTRRLASLARQAGIETWHVESVDELDARNFEKKMLAGLTAGASTPKSLIDEVEKWLLHI